MPCVLSVCRPYRSSSASACIRSPTGGPAQRRCSRGWKPLDNIGLAGTRARRLQRVADRPVEQERQACRPSSSPLLPLTWCQPLQLPAGRSQIGAIVAAPKWLLSRMVGCCPRDPPTGASAACSALCCSPLSSVCLQYYVQTVAVVVCARARSERASDRFALRSALTFA